jgi:adenine/guanine/hypoxanthine permease
MNLVDCTKRAAPWYEAAMRGLAARLANGQPIGVEIRAGVTTWLTMAYILFVNPDILSRAIQIPGVDVRAELLTTTALAAATGTLFMGLVARYPFALAPGMGLNAYFTYAVVQGAGVPWQSALGAVFVSGVLTVVITVAGVREVVVNAIPASIRSATGAGIGLFLAIIGCQNMGLVVAHPVTLVGLGDLRSPAVLLGLFGLLASAGLLARRVRGAILIGILATTLLAHVTAAPVFGGAPFPGFGGGLLRPPAWPSHIALALDVGGAFDLGIFGIIFMFMFVDFFDTAGTLFGLADRSGLLDAQGRLPRAGRAFFSDAMGTVCGALLGTSSTTTYVESAAGIEDGGRSGLTAVSTAACFLLSIFFSPVAGAVPGVATAPALVIIGAMMMSSVSRVDWSEYRIAVPAFLTVVAMPLTYSIANGVSFGIISYTALHVVTGELNRVHWLMAVLTLLLVGRFVYMGAG